MTARLDLEDCFAEIDDAHARTITWRRHVHQHPELSNREARTAAYIREQLVDEGIDPADVTGDLGGHGLLVRITGRGEGDADRAIMLRADIDALPVREDSDVDFASEVVDEDYPGGPFPVAHACGHDCHTAMLMAAAMVLHRHRDAFAGTVYCAFQPAEEGAPVGEEGGARVMLAEPVFAELDPRPTSSFGMHVGPGPKGWVGYREGVQHASSERVRITVTGEQVHGSSPWHGRDPLPPAADIIAAMGQIYRQFDAQDAFTITIGHVEDQGRFNIVCDEVVLWGTVRCLKDGLMTQVNEAIDRTARHIAEAYGCRAETAFDQVVPAVVHTPETVARMLPALRAAAGDPTMVQPAPASLGYDDVSEFINRYGGLYALLGVQDVTVTRDGQLVPEEGGRGFRDNHSPQFYADEDTLTVGVRLHVAVALHHLGAVEL